VKCIKKRTQSNVQYFYISIRRRKNTVFDRTLNQTSSTLLNHAIDYRRKDSTSDSPTGISSREEES
jgi:hypothetical protein